jgi:glycosyltransferase involved in cell wall biosynthesis
VPSRANPLVSIVICVYNGERFLRETLDSVLAQRISDIEVLAVDDGSTDRSLELLESYDEPRLRIVRLQHAGVVSALNAGLELARGEFIGFLDQDDLWASHKLDEHCRTFNEHPDVDLTFSWYRLLDEESNELGLCPRRCHGRFSYSSLLRDYVIGPTSTVVMRREALNRTGLADPAFSGYYDVDLFLRTSLVRPDNVAAVPSALTFYRRHRAQMSKDWRFLRKEWYQLLHKFRRLAPESTVPVERFADVNMTRYFAYLAYEDRDFRSALNLLSGSLKRFPRAFLADTRNWLAGAASLSGRVLPVSLHRRLERLANVTTDGVLRIP